MQRQNARPPPAKRYLSRRLLTGRGATMRASYAVFITAPSGTTPSFT